MFCDKQHGNMYFAITVGYGPSRPIAIDHVASAFLISIHTEKMVTVCKIEPHNIYVKIILYTNCVKFTQILCKIFT